MLPGARLAVLALALVLLMPGCAKNVPAELKGGGVFNAFLMEPASLDPAWVRGPMEQQVARQIFDGLTDYDPESMETVPAMADSWTAGPDATLWTFFLKRGVSFHNGRECTAADFIYSWNRLADPRTAGPASFHLAPVKGFQELQGGAANDLSGLRAVDDYTLEVTLEYPYADFPARVAHPAFSPVPWEEVGDDFGERPVGTGPFRLERWEHGSELVIGSYPDYYGESRPFLDQVAFRIYPDIESGWKDFKAGLLDDVQIPPGQYDAAVIEHGEKAMFKPLLSTLFYGFNMQMEPWKSGEDFRQALNWAVDRVHLSISIMQGTASPATGLVAQGSYGWQSPAMPYRYDPEKAKSLISKSFPYNQGIPIDLTLDCNNGELQGLVARSVQSDFRQVGVVLAIESHPPGAYAELVGSGGAGFFCLEWQADYPVMDAFLYPLLHSGGEGPANPTGYRNPEVDALLERARRTTDTGKRIDLYRQAEKLALGDAPVMPLTFSNSSRVISERVEGYRRTPLDYTPFESVYLLNSP